MIRLGDQVVDSITGFKGIAVARFSYLVGPDVIQVQAMCVDNNPGAVSNFEEERLLASLRELVIMKCGEDPKVIS